MYLARCKCFRLKLELHKKIIILYMYEWHIWPIISNDLNFLWWNSVLKKFNWKFLLLTKNHMLTWNETAYKRNHRKWDTMYVIKPWHNSQQQKNPQKSKEQLFYCCSSFGMHEFCPVKDNFRYEMSYCILIHE